MSDLPSGFTLISRQTPLGASELVFADIVALVLTKSAIGALERVVDASGKGQIAPLSPHPDPIAVNMIAKLGSSIIGARLTRTSCPDSRGARRDTDSAHRTTTPWGVSGYRSR